MRLRFHEKKTSSFEKNRCDIYFSLFSREFPSDAEQEAVVAMLNRLHTKEELKPLLQNPGTITAFLRCKAAQPDGQLKKDQLMDLAMSGPKLKKLANTVAFYKSHYEDLR